MSERDTQASTSPGSGSRPPAHRTSRQPWAIVAIVIAAIIIAIIVWRVVWDATGGHKPATPPVPVVAATARTGNFTVYQFAPGTVTPLNTVTVHSRVDGVLTSVKFQGGEMVKRGALLATVDAGPLGASLASAQAKLASKQAQLANAQDVLKRYQKLLAEHSIEPQRVKSQQALVRQYTAAVKADQSMVDTAHKHVDYTRITAPISGMVGLRKVDPGNLVGPSQAHGIVVVTQLKPTSVTFAIPADVVPPVRKRLQNHKPVTVTVYGSSGQQALGTGQLIGTANHADPATGTVMLKARFANTDGVLFPSQAVTARLPVRTLNDAVLVPSAAIQEGATGPFVYVVKADHTVAVTPVTTGPDNGTTTVITHGIKAGQVVVTEGAGRLRAGTHVAPRPATSATPRNAAQAAGARPKTTPAHAASTPGRHRNRSAAP